MTTILNIFVIAECVALFYLGWREWRNIVRQEARLRTFFYLSEQYEKVVDTAKAHAASMAELSAKADNLVADLLAVKERNEAELHARLAAEDLNKHHEEEAV